MAHVNQHIQCDLRKRNPQQIETFNNLILVKLTGYRSSVKGVLARKSHYDLLSLKDVPEVLQAQTLQELTYVHVQHCHYEKQNKTKNPADLIKQIIRTKAP